MFKDPLIMLVRPLLTKRWQLLKSIVFMIIIAILSLYCMVGHAIYLGEWSNKLLVISGLISGLFIAFVAYIEYYGAAEPPNRSMLNHDAQMSHPVAG